MKRSNHSMFYGVMITRHAARLDFFRHDGRVFSDKSSGTKWNHKFARNEGALLISTGCTIQMGRLVHLPMSTVYHTFSYFLL